MHLTRYLHLNPVTAYLVDKPEQWAASSYKEFLDKTGKINKFCSYGDILDIQQNRYKKFVEEAISYQKELAQAKRWLFED